MSDKSVNHFNYTFEIKIPQKITSDELADILSKVEDKIYEFLEEKLKIKLLEPPLEAEIVRKDNSIKINLTIKLVISPFSYYFSRKKEVVDMILRKFYEVIRQEIKDRG